MLWTVAKEAAENWSRHQDSRQGAALAYYSVFSIGPLIVIAIAIAGFVFGREAVTGQVALFIKDMLGDTGAKAVQATMPVGLKRVFSQHPWGSVHFYLLRMASSCS